MTWPKIKLGDLCESVSTFNPARGLPDETFTYIDIAAVNRETKRIEEVNTLRNADAPSRARQSVKKNDILVSTVRPNLNAVAKVTSELEDAVASTGFTVLRVKPSALFEDWLFHWVKSLSFVDDMTDRATGASYPAVSDRIVKDSQIPLPPLPEQKRLAAILDRADELRRLRRQVLARLDELAQSLFLEIFGDPATNPKGWDVVRLGKLTSVVSSGSTPLGGSTTYLNEGILFIRSQNVLMKAFDFSDAAFISETTHKQMRRTWVKNGDVLLNITGASIGRVNYFDGEDDSANVNQHVCIVRPDKNLLTPQYLSNFLATETFQRVEVANNNGATRQAFTFQQIKDFEIPLPPLPLQQQFASQIEELEAVKARARASLLELDALFASLQSRAFAGELSG